MYDNNNDRGQDEIFETIDRSFGDKKEELRVSIGEFKGKKFASIRTFWMGNQGDWLPGKAGITVRTKELSRVIDALQEIQQRLGG